MGLDMHFYRHHFYSDLDADGATHLTTIQTITGPHHQGNVNFQHCSVFIPIGYLRGEYGVHQWIVKNVLDGADYGGYHLIELRDIAKLRGADIDIQDAECVEAVFAALEAEGDHEFYYSASW